MGFFFTVHGSEKKIEGSALTCNWLNQARYPAHAEFRTLTSSHYLAHFENLETHAQEATQLPLNNWSSTYTLRMKLKENDFSFQQYHLHLQLVLWGKCIMLVENTTSKISVHIIRRYLRIGKRRTGESFKHGLYKQRVIRALYPVCLGDSRWWLHGFTETSISALFCWSIWSDFTTQTNVSYIWLQLISVAVNENVCQYLLLGLS